MSDLKKYRQDGPIRKQFTMAEMDSLGVSLKYCAKPDLDTLVEPERSFQQTLRERTISPLYLDIQGKYRLSDSYLNPGSVTIVREEDMPEEIYNDLIEQVNTY